MECILWKAQNKYLILAIDTIQYENTTIYSSVAQLKKIKVTTVHNQIKQCLSGAGSEIGISFNLKYPNNRDFTFNVNNNEFQNRQTINPDQYCINNTINNGTNNTKPSNWRTDSRSPQH